MPLMLTLLALKPKSDVLKNTKSLLTIEKSQSTIQYTLIRGASKIFWDGILIQKI